MTRPDWLPADFQHPTVVQATPDVHLRPIRASDVDIDMVAVLGNQEMLWSIYGEAWQWPPATMTREQDEEDLAHHAADMEEHRSFNYAILRSDESELLGCLYIEPIEPDLPAGIAEVSWWLVGSASPELRSRMDRLVPEWIEQDWPFTEVRYPYNKR